MEANELRIGNLIEYRISDRFDKRKEWWEVSEIDADDIHWLSKVMPEDEDFKAIPLTEEWLLKFGFINDKVLEFYKNNSSESTIIIDYNFICLLGYSHVKLKYVHQLQNLFYSICEKELEIKQ